MSASVLELSDIQSGLLRPRPTPYAAAYLVFRLHDRAGGRALIRRLVPVIPAAEQATSPTGEAWVSASLSFQGLVALGVPQVSLDSFPLEFRQGMAARAKLLGDVGESAPEQWEPPLGTPDVHVVLTVLAPDQGRLDHALARVNDVHHGLGGSSLIWRQDCHIHADEREPFGFKDGISHPAIEGSGIPGTNPHEVPLKAGEFVLGYPDEISPRSAIPQPEVLGRNGSYIVFRKLHQKVALFRRYLRENAKDAAGEEWLAAKLMGRWRSGAPLALSPDRDDPPLGDDARRNNAFGFQKDDPVGYRTPPSSHIRRMNPRDAAISGVARIHRMIRRGTAYGPPLPEGVLEDDGADRGLMFAFVGAHLARQFEFVQSEWMNDSRFYGGRDEKDPVSGAAGDGATNDIPRRPLRLRLQGLPRFVQTRGGEYGFMPGLRALRWLGDLKD